ncbi:MAG: twin-arginine translocase TatA/TatE family subunit [Acidimicrobiales bacterium]
MFNVGTGELMVILLVALLVLGPTKLPGAARQTAKTLTELRKVSTGFQREMKAAMDDAFEVEARDRGAKAVSSEAGGATTPAADASTAAQADDAASAADSATPPPADSGSGTGDPAVSTAEAAGMYAASGEPDDAASDDADRSS